MDPGMTAWQDGTALIAVERRRSRDDAGTAHRDGAPGRVDTERKAVVPAEILERRDVLREHLFGRSRCRSPDHPQPRAQVMRADGGSRLEAVIGIDCRGWLAGLRVGSAASSQRKRCRYLLGGNSSADLSDSAAHWNSTSYLPNWLASAAHVMRYRLPPIGNENCGTRSASTLPGSPIPGRR